MSDTLIQRALRPDDAAAVTGILAAMERAEPADVAFSQQEITEELIAPGVDLGRGSVAVLEVDRLVAFGWLRISPLTSTWKAYQWAGVQPDYVGRGLGHRLLAGLEAAAVAIRDEDAPGRPGEIKVWVEQDRPRTGALVDATGYDTWRYFFRMRSDLRGPVPAVAEPGGVHFRPFRAADDDQVRLVSNESFADHWGSTPMDTERWRAEFADSSSFRPEYSQVAVIEGTVVGFVLSSEFVADTEQRGYRTGYIARVGTGRAARGRGIATALLARTLEGLADAGYRYAELEVDADSPTGAGRLYERAGFVTIGRNRVVGKRF